MQLATPDIEIEQGEVFANDLLGRQLEIQSLAPLLLNVDAPLVMALDSPWGTGKTTFVRLLRAYLEEQGKQSLYFNAWETDYADDPLVALAATLDDYVEASVSDTVVTESWCKAKKYLPVLGKSVLKAGVKAATFGALDVEEEYEAVLAELAQGSISDLVDQFSVQQSAIDAFKESISKILATLTDNQKNLVIFIDELDRCRPTYAIETLERIKHIFDLEGIVFVLSVDAEQLCHSIKAVYGADFDARQYLKRFINLDYSLSRPEMPAYVNAMLINMGLQNAVDGRRNARQDLDTTAKSFIFLAEAFELNWREINLYLARLRLVFAQIPSNHHNDLPLLIPLLFVRDKNPQLYQRYVSDTGCADEVISYLDGILKPTQRFERRVVVMKGYLIAPNVDDYRDDQLVVDRLLAPYSDIPEDDPERAERAEVFRLLQRVVSGARDFGSIDIGVVSNWLELLGKISLADGTAENI
ncbi:hypothetical protein BST95_08995 [Halioglobus japonicus]|uniref:NTPase KAP n=1 Tax=Halioglobus japonicus TaxID=930805 RepID=A0AAP8MEH7_9GAMM|nr:P-loop NTPase fold protein [Halioglobus japonicus]AQA18347.1 hypothetical protein BST95_08995 [Halioglobus japonicus]PLW86365.1 NTPase KAP [Halioglobus japonicus]GHD13254.1 hypothetical protein GCM10007052_15190 [Halioglobus japonicus]